MHNETIERVKRLRIEKNFKVDHVAQHLNISEEEYLRFEAGEFDLEQDYFILASLTFLYDVSLDFLLGREKTERKEGDYVRDDMQDFSYLAAMKRDALLPAVKTLGVISEAQYKALKSRVRASKCRYTDEEGNEAFIAVTGDYSDESGYYFAMPEGEVEIAYLNTEGDTEYFAVGDRRYLTKFCNVIVLGRLYARIEG